MKYRSGHVIFNIDYKMSGLGSNSFGPELQNSINLMKKNLVMSLF